LTRTVRLDAPVAAGVLFDYLSDPFQRPQWQSSLRAVADVRGSGEPGSSWTDVTAVGARPRMRITAAESPRLWIERGRWRGLSAVLRLDLLGYGPARTRVRATFRVSGVGVFALVAPLLELAAAPAIRADLRRAVLLAARTHAESDR